MLQSRPRRRTFPRCFALLGLVGLGVMGLGPVLAADFQSVPRIPFQIATGSSAGAYFPVGEAIAGLISHPPGIDRCESVGVCGPPGLMASARASQGTMDNLAAVDGGMMDSGLAQSDVVAAAVKGADIFRRSGPKKHVRVIASLFPEEVHLVAASHARIAGVIDLRGKRVSLGAENSGIGFTAREILRAWRLPEKSLRVTHQDTGSEIAAMKAGTLDAFFVVGGVPETSLTDLLASKAARLVPIDGAGRERLVKAVPSLLPANIPAGAYPGTGAVATVATRAVWVVRDSTPEPVVYAIARALFNPANRAQLAGSHPSAREIGLATASLNPPAPLHPGAARFYREAQRALR